MRLCGILKPSGPTDIFVEPIFEESGTFFSQRVDASSIVTGFLGIDVEDVKDQIIELPGATEVTLGQPAIFAFHAADGDVQVGDRYELAAKLLRSNVELLAKPTTTLAFARFVGSPFLEHAATCAEFDRLKAVSPAFVERWHQSTSLGSFRARGPLLNSALFDALSESYNAQTIVALISSFLDPSAPPDHRLGNELGRMIGLKRPVADTNDGPFSGAWSYLLGLDEVAEDGDIRLFLLALLRGYFEIVIDSSCKPSDLDRWKQRLQRSADTSFSLAQEIVSRLNKAEDLAALSVGVSQFPECSIYASLASFLVAAASRGQPRLYEQSVDYETPHEGGDLGANFRIVNQKSIPQQRSLRLQRKKITPQPIYVHQGYCFYITRAFLKEALTRPECTDAGVSAIRRLLDGAQPHDISLECRCWLLCWAGVQEFPKSEFPDLIAKIKETAETFAEIPRGPRGTRDPTGSFDAAFEAFISGASDAFFGGSVHDLLLERWWLGHTPCFLKLIDPEDVRQLHETNRFVNILVPGGSLIFTAFGQSTEFEEFWQTLENLYLEIGRFLAQLASDPRRNEGDLRAVLYFVDENSRRSPSAKWSFITAVEDLVSLVLERSTFPTDEADLNQDGELVVEGDGRLRLVERRGVG